MKSPEQEKKDLKTWWAAAQKKKKDWEKRIADMEKPAKARPKKP